MGNIYAASCASLDEGLHSNSIHLVRNRIAT